MKKQFEDLMNQHSINIVSIEGNLATVVDLEDTEILHEELLTVPIDKFMAFVEERTRAGNLLKQRRKSTILALTLHHMELNGDITIGPGNRISLPTVS